MTPEEKKLVGIAIDQGSWIGRKVTFSAAEKLDSRKLRQKLRQLYAVVVGATISFLPATFLFASAPPLANNRLTWSVFFVWLFSLGVLIHEWWRNSNYYWNHELVFNRHKGAGISKFGAGIAKFVYEVGNSAYVVLLVSLALAVAVGVRQTPSHELLCSVSGGGATPQTICVQGDSHPLKDGAVYSLIPVVAVLGLLQIADALTTACHIWNKWYRGRPLRLIHNAYPPILGVAAAGVALLMLVENPPSMAFGITLLYLGYVMKYAFEYIHIYWLYRRIDDPDPDPPEPLD